MLMRCLLSAVAAAILWASAAQFAFVADDLDTASVGLFVAELADAKAVFREMKLTLPTKEGVLVIKVQPYSPAQKCGMRPLDTADDWLFSRSYTLKADGKTFAITPPPLSGVERDNAAGKIWEWYEIPVTKKEIPMLDAIVAGRELHLRYDGRQYFKDRSIGEEERSRLATVLAAFKAMGGE